jgi:hypothetical protein
MSEPIQVKAKYTNNQIDFERIKNNFVYHAPVGDQVQRYEWIREGAKVYAEFLIAVCPLSRELSLALTNLEQAVMWANAAIARNES